jgi:hypothetical protein
MICVLIHYESLNRLSRLMPLLKVHHRFKIVFGVLGALAAHAAEIWIFALAYYAMISTEGWGELTGESTSRFMDCAYFSFTVYSTLGFGDIIPSGDLRYLTGIEALTGLVLITWSASFLYLEMQKYWDDGETD